MVQSTDIAIPKVTIEEVSDPKEIARSRAQHERARQNEEWLQAHWGDLPQAEGRFVVVAGQEAFVTDTPQAAWQWAKTHHPDDDGALVMYVPARKGWWIYATCR